MLITIRIDSNLKSRIDQLVQTGQYPDFNAATVVAMENLWTAEQEFASAGNAPSKRPVAHREILSSAAITDVGIVATPEIQPESPAIHWTVRTVAKDIVQPFAGDRFAKGEKVPVERWVFGQQNRLLPLKVNSRLLIAYAESNGDAMALSKLAERISVGAANVYLYLAALDQRLGHKKDEMLATAFPAPDSDKSRQRYADHFVAVERTTGELSGLLLEWKLATVVRKKTKAYLFPTDAGAAWANLSNPLLDVDVTTNPVKFSESEIDWALCHVAQHVPAECYAFKTLLIGIQAGADDPTKLDAYLRKVEVVIGKDTSSEFVATQRSGALSRMADLELIRRIRNGVRVTYAASERATAWLKLI